MTEEKTISIANIQRDVEMELSNKETLHTLVATTFKGLTESNVRQAMVEGFLRGYTLKDFLEKNIYAIPYNVKQRDGSYAQVYSLVISIDQVRKVGMRSGVSGMEEPKYEEGASGEIISCSLTVHRRLPGSDLIGDFTAKVYFSEYVGDKMIWKTKPRTMIAKVAEMHALRKACPEELAQAYVEEEFDSERKQAEVVKPTVDIASFEAKLKATQSLDELMKVWADLPAEAKAACKDLKDGLAETFGTK